MKDALWVVVPVYNESHQLSLFLQEWMDVLRKEVGDFYFLCIDDGSTDDSYQILNDYKHAHNLDNMILLHHPNQGHGKTCLLGYHFALQHNARWVLQIDSDGQCDPLYFPYFWRQREQYPLQFGNRLWRKDGVLRMVITWILPLAILAWIGRYIKDINVPYRLMKADVLKAAIPDLACCDLLNAYITFRLQMQNKILWIPIVFKARRHGQSKHNLKSGFAKIFDLFLALKSESKAIA